MTININVSGRFKVLDQPYSLPSKCAFCSLGHNQNGTVSFIDTTLDLDFYGVVYICSTCLTEIAASLGYISPDAWEKIVEDSTNSLIRCERLQAENDGLRNAVNILTGHHCSDAPVPSPDILKDEGFTTDEGLISGALKGVESAEPEPNASSSESGLSDVRGPAKPKPSKSAVKSDSGTDIFDL